MSIKIGLIGHEGHGKTAIANALIANAGTKYEVFDNSGKVQKVKKLLFKLAKVDTAVLVVSALDGPMPQTYEHLLLASALKTQNVVVFINKLDAVEDPEVLELIELEVRELLTKTGYNGEATPIIYGSAELALANDESVIGSKSIQSLIAAIDSVSKPKVKKIALQVHSKFTANIVTLDKYQGGRHTSFKSGFTPSFFFDDTTITGALILNAGLVVEPGEEATVGISLIRPTFFDVGSTFIIREGNKTIGLGSVTGISD